MARYTKQGSVVMKFLKSFVYKPKPLPKVAKQKKPLKGQKRLF